MAKIFISHKKEDSHQAGLIYNFLKQKKIDLYLDVLDPDLVSDGIALTKYLRSKLNDCTHLLTLLSSSTQSSWWVPFEIGLATERGYPISSYLLPSAIKPIPTYLWNWPVLQSISDLDKYATMVLKSEQTVLLETLHKGFFSSANSYQDAFHKNLKNQLGQ